MNTQVIYHRIRQVSLCLLLATSPIACDQADSESSGHSTSHERPQITESDTAEGSRVNARTAPPTSSFDSVTVDLELDTSEIGHRAVGLFIGLIREFRMYKSWDTIDDWATAFEWKPIPSQYNGVLGAEIGYAELSGGGQPILIGINPSQGSMGVSFVQTQGHEEVVRLLSDAMRLKELISVDELGTHSIMYAAATNSERLGIITIGWGTHELAQGTVTLGFIEPDAAVKIIPKVERTFRAMETDDR